MESGSRLGALHARTPAFMREAFARELAACLVVAGLATALATWVLRVWRADFHVPFLYISDGNLNQALIKGILDNGWHFENPDLGAPFGLELYDYPVLSGDLLNVLLIKGLGLFSSDSAAVLNAFFLLTFPLVALCAYLALRLLRVSVAVSIVCATLYSLAPYHFGRGVNHFLLSAYYVVPIGVYLALSVLGSRPLFERRAGAHGRLGRFASRRTLETLALCALVALASGSFYYSGFTVLLVLAAALLRFGASRGKEALVSGGVVAAVIVGFSLLQLLPTIVYHQRHGDNPQVAQRHSSESEGFSLRPAQLVLPLETHRLDVFAHRRQAYDSWGTSPRTEAALSTLGTIAAIGFLIALGALLVAAVPNGRRRLPELYGLAGLLALVALLIATHGGLSSFFGAIYPQFRGWNRLSIFISFLGFFVVALILDRLRGLLAPRRWGRPLAIVLLAGVLTLGALDQTSDAFIPPYKALAAEYNHDRAFVRQLEERLPVGSMVFELPIFTFPEPPPSTAGLYEYDLIKPYLHSRRLRWSYGAMRGRLPADWAARFAAKPLAEVIPGVAAAGFSGLYVARLGYVNATSLETELAAVIGGPTLRSPDGRLDFYDLRPYRAELERQRSPRELRLLRAATLGRGG